MKRRFLVLYDYGQGGLWGYVGASSAEEITARFPEVEIVEDTPAWLTMDLRKKLEQRTEDLDDPGDGLLGILSAGRDSAG